MSFSYRYRKQILIGLVCFVMILGVSLFLVFGIKSESHDKVNDKSDLLKITKKKVKKQSDSADSKTSIMYKVDIKGAVNTPGIYSLDKESRVIDVINMAGGLREDADTTVINLSKKITDEMVIIIYTHQEVSDFSHYKETEKVIQQKCIQKDEDSLKNDACISSDNTTEDNNTVISINSATKEELMKLTGIGESRANDIIEYREKNGGFKSIDELKNVKGIGDSLFDKIKENITL